ncbi:CST complex subunit CTC1 isoform X3 [Dendrobium catenatum]|uniref:CST complex subunit CTC1 isoform X3 n=1 Tax=Dendrobium catenatum TaxID=906689 RepID=UPI0009F37CB0|nr:CST complex subunit CTC1 isoform X3 [Dendrobium catenatum]
MPLSMAEVRIITISDLLSLSLPLTGVTDLSLSLSSCSPPLKKHKHQPAKVIEAENLTNLLICNKHLNPELFFTPFKCPVVLVGTVDLPTDPSDHFFSFCDGSSIVSCAILDLDLRIIGCKVHVLAWNFLPFKDRRGGLLEVIRWSTFSPSLAMPKDMPVLSLRKGVELSSKKGVVGVLRSVSPVFTVPCRNTGSDSDSIGFLAELFTCKCNLCSKSFYMYRFDYSLWIQNSHCFSVSDFVYFLEPSSGWRLALAKLVGKVVMVSGLKRKMIFVGEKISYAMYVTPLETSVSLGRLPLEAMQLGEDVRAKMIEDGAVYNGIITRVYMQGMAVELDDKVWLLVTDSNLAPLAALRVGAIISIQNFQLVRSVLSWIETNLLVCCSRTAIDVKSFSISDTRCHFRSQSPSLLLRFIESLTPTAKFCRSLLLISCFRRKFAKLLSNKEILGSRNHGIFMDFCQHGQSAIKYEKNGPPLKLVVPLSNFIIKCEVIWASALKEIPCHGGKPTIVDNVPCEGIPSSPMVRRIVSNDIFGCILMGIIKITSSGKLQLFDSTGSIDVVIPDIVSGFHCQGIHEVKEFKVVLEGPSMQVESSELHSAELLSCRSFFDELPVKKKISQLVVYVVFYLKNSTCLNAPINLPLCTVDKSNTNASGIAHLLLVTHKFPAAKNCEFDSDASHSSSLFSEALLLPYDAIFHNEDAHNHPSGHSLQKLDGEPVYLSELNIPQLRCCRKPNFVESIWDSPDSKYDLKRAELRPVFACLLTFGSSPQKPHFTGYLCSRGCSVLENKSVGLHPVLLEFISDSFIKYQSLQIGGYYMMKCSKECPLCFQKVKNKETSSKVLLSSKTSLWKVFFSFGMDQHQEQPRYQTSSDNLIREYQTDLVNVCESDLEFQPSCTLLNDISDVHLAITRDSMAPLSQIDLLKEELLNHFSMLQEVLTVTSFIQIMKSDKSSSSSHANSQHGSLVNSNLISIRGNIENMHLFFKFGSFISNENVVHSHRRDECICLHVYDDQNMIYIQGKLHHYTYPVGLGPGVNATFHRVLLKCSSDGFPKLVLTSVSFVVINSVKETGFLYSKRLTMRPQFDRNSEDTLNSVSLSLISNLVQLMDIKRVRLLSRVVTIHYLVLKKLELDHGRSGSRMEIKMPSIKISLAGFLLDDGSSLCCCWADGERAEMLLRLDKISCHPFFQFGDNSVKKSFRYHETIGHQLENMLRKHQKVIMKNHRAVPDVSSLDFTFYVDSSEIFSSAEESLLRFVISNACQGSTFNISGHLMDSTALGLLDMESKDLQDIVRPLPNIWAAEIQHNNSLKQARKLLDELSTG